METVRVQLPDVVIDEGLQLANMPAGIPLSTSPTVPEKLFTAPTFTVKLVLLPAVTVCEAGEAAREKSAVVSEPDTSRLKVAAFESVPLNPLTVTE